MRPTIFLFFRLESPPARRGGGSSTAGPSLSPSPPCRASKHQRQASHTFPQEQGQLPYAPGPPISARGRRRRQACKSVSEVCPAASLPRLPARQNSLKLYRPSHADTIICRQMKADIGFLRHLCLLSRHELRHRHHLIQQPRHEVSVSPTSRDSALSSSKTVSEPSLSLALPHRRVYVR